MYRVTFVSSLFSPDGLDREDSNKTLGVLLEALTKVNEIQMQRRRFPPLYTSGIRYKAEPIGEENWLDAVQALLRRWIDCEDASAYRAAELRVYFRIPARPVFIFGQDKAGRQLYHCRVRYPASYGPQHPSAKLIGDEYEEDPSVELGMVA
ncbi:MAG TPA: hypothetical protein PK156_46765 [Polyangium sp.]|nr:hypothetical protein [Polyangium sp.]